LNASACCGAIWRTSMGGGAGGASAVGEPTRSDGVDQAEPATASAQASAVPPARSNSLGRSRHICAAERAIVFVTELQ